MENKHKKTKISPTAAKSMAALSAMLAFSICPAGAFHPSFLAPRARSALRFPSSFNAVRPATVTMNSAPWHTDVDILQRQPQGQHRRAAAILFAPRGWYQSADIQRQQLLQMSDPVVIEDTDDNYMLSFALPAEVDHDGLQVSVSGRLLTVKARITREENPDPAISRGGWVSRSSRTDSVSRSFNLPEGVLASSANTSFVADGKFEVKFNKDRATTGGTTPMTTAPSAYSTTDSGTMAAVDTPTATKAAPVPPTDSTVRSSTTRATANTASTAAGSPAAADRAASSRSSPTDATRTSGTEPPPSRPESALEALDHEFREFAEAMWGDYALPRARVPTPEEREKQAAEAREWRAKRKVELAARVKAAKEDRARRVTAMRRATMAADISQAEDGSSYLVEFALPQGMRRDDVNLTVNPDRSLRVTAYTAVANGAPGRSVYKDVLLPKDAILSDVSAKFVAEHEDDDPGINKQGGVDKAEGAIANVGLSGLVSGIKVTVGKAAPPRPKSIDIL